MDKDPLKAMLDDLKDEYPATEMDIEKATRMAEAHVKWFMDHIKPLLISFSVHFYGHGFKDGKGE